jgi:YegS/Rv2252/BmrU family lipid kinase
MTPTKDQKKTLLILNPAAGKGKGKKNFDSLHSRLADRFENLDVKTSEYPGHNMEIGKEAAKNGIERIISIGGDGTPFEIINGLYADGIPEQEVEFGMIPAGTGNSFLRDFDGASQETWVETVCKGNSRKVDLVEFSYMMDGKEINQYYLNILGVGLIADILKLTNEKLKFLGTLGYSLAVLIRLFRGMHNRMMVKVDNHSFELENSALVINNSKFTGGEMKIAPMADTADGKVDMIVFNHVNRRDILSIFANVFKGKHVDHPRVDVFSGSRMEIDAQPPQRLTADGELLGYTPLKLKVLPGQLKLLAP